MLTQKLTKRQQAKAIRLFACKGQKNAYCVEYSVGRMTLYRMLKGNAVETKHIETLTNYLSKRQ